MTATQGVSKEEVLSEISNLDLSSQRLIPDMNYLTNLIINEQSDVISKDTLIDLVFRATFRNDDYVKDMLITLHAKILNYTDMSDRWISAVIRENSNCDLVSYNTAVMIFTSLNIITDEIGISNSIMVTSKTIDQRLCDLLYLNKEISFNLIRFAMERFDDDVDMLLDVIECMCNHKRSWKTIYVTYYLWQQLSEIDREKIRITSSSNEHQYFAILGMTYRKFFKLKYGEELYRIFNKRNSQQFQDWSQLHIVNMFTNVFRQHLLTSFPDWDFAINYYLHDIHSVNQQITQDGYRIIDLMVDTPVSALKGFFVAQEGGYSLNIHNHNLYSGIITQALTGVKHIGSIEDCIALRKARLIRARLDDLIGASDESLFVDAVIHLEKLYPQSYSRMKCPQSLKELGEEMHNCVGGYVELCKRDTVIYKVKHGKECAVLELKQRLVDKDDISLQLKQDIVKIYESSNGVDDFLVYVVYINEIKAKYNQHVSDDLYKRVLSDLQQARLKINEATTPVFIEYPSDNQEMSIQ